MNDKELLNSSLKGYAELEEVKDPTLLGAEYLFKNLSAICPDCPRNDTCNKSKLECPAILAYIDGVNNRIHDSQTADYWVGIELDGTLSKLIDADSNYYLNIGDPYPHMVELVKNLLEGDVKVKIFTPRVAYNNSARVLAEKTVKKWAKKHIGQVLEVTAEKDGLCVSLISGTTKQAVPEDGVLLEELFFKSVEDLQKARKALTQIDIMTSGRLKDGSK